MPIIYHKKINHLLGKYILQPLYKKYSSRTTGARIYGIKLIILKGVFHPGFFFSSKILMKWMDKQNLQHLNVLDLGCGSGVLSIFAAQKGCRVTAIDINPVACECSRINARANGQDVSVIQSDMFTNIPLQVFDLIMINPPFYPRDPATPDESAWYCGENFEYFVALFSQIKGYMHSGSRALMILSEDCNIPHIENIATNNGYHWQMIHEDRGFFEKNYLFTISK